MRLFKSTQLSTFRNTLILELFLNYLQHSCRLWQRCDKQLQEKVDRYDRQKEKNAFVPPIGFVSEYSSEEGWRVFRTLEKNAIEGKLPNASVEHDRYLYG